VLFRSELMKNRFMISVAAFALVAGTGLANAQSTGHESGSGAQTQQHQSDHGGAMNKGSAGQDKGTVGQAGGSGSMKSGSEDKSSGMNANEKSSGSMNKNQASDEKSGATKGQRSDEHAQGSQDKSKNMSSDEHSKSGSKDMKAEGREGRDTNTKAEDNNRNGTNNAQNRQGTSTDTNRNAEGRTGTNTTVGQAGAGAKLSTEQRTKITSVFREEKVAPVNNVNFSISVGTRVPREGVEFHTLPQRVVTIYPEWRSYKYIMVRDQIVIIDPNTYEIVAVLNV